MKKRFFSVLLAIIICFSFAACRRADTDEGAAADTEAAGVTVQNEQPGAQEELSADEPSGTEKATAQQPSTADKAPSQPTAETAAPSAAPAQKQDAAPAPTAQDGAAKQEDKTEAPKPEPENEVDPYPGVQQGFCSRDPETGFVSILSDSFTVRYPMSKELYEKTEYAYYAGVVLNDLRSSKAVYSEDELNKILAYDGMIVVRGTFDDEMGDIVQYCTRREGRAYKTHDFDYQMTCLSRNFTVSKSYGSAIKDGDRIRVSASGMSFVSVKGENVRYDLGKCNVPTLGMSEKDRSYLIALQYREEVGEYVAYSVMIPLNEETYGDLDPQTREYYDTLLKRFN